MLRALAFALTLALASSASAHPGSQVVASPTAEPQGEPVEVEWQGTWYPAMLLELDGDRAYICYDGYGEQWNEWVGPERIRSLRDGLAMAHAGWRIGQSVEVEWGGTWWDATVVDTDGERSQIHYVGWGDRWDEWVDDSRIR